MGALTSMNIFLRQEVDRMQRVITTVRNTLVDLKLAIDGTIIMSENLKDALDNIYDARVPALWKKVSPRIRYQSFEIRSFTFFKCEIEYNCHLDRRNYLTKETYRPICHCKQSLLHVVAVVPYMSFF